MTLRWLVLGLALCRCAHVPTQEAPRWPSVAASLPKETAGAVPFEPARYDGQVVLVTFVASWCFPCLTDFVVLERLERELGPTGFHNVLVGMDLEGRMVLEPFAKNYNLAWPLIIANDAVRTGATPFGPIRTLPTRVLFGRDGRAVAAYTGLIDYPVLEQLVRDALAAR